MKNSSKLVLKIPGVTSLECDTAADASGEYSRLRDESGEGASDWPEGQIWHMGKMIARVSYNGKIWNLGEWKSGDAPIYNPYATVADYPLSPRERRMSATDGRIPALAQMEREA